MSLIRRLKLEGYKVVVLTEFDGYENQIGLEVDNIEPLFISRKDVNPFVDFFTIAELKLIEQLWEYLWKAESRF